jgi:hypothetical protein
LRVERDVADLVTDQQRDPAERGELVLEPPLALGVGESGDPLGGRREPDAVPSEAGADRDRDRQEASMSVKAS